MFRKFGWKASITDKIYISYKDLNYIHTTVLPHSNHQVTKLYLLRVCKNDKKLALPSFHSGRSQDLLICNRSYIFPSSSPAGLTQTSPIPTVTASLHRPPRGLSRSARRSGRHLPDLHSTPYQNNTRCSTPQKHWGRVFNISFSPTQQTRPWDTSKLLAAGSQYRRGTNHF